MPSTTVALPNVAEIVGQLLLRVPAEQRPLLIAIAERLAAQRYRDWAQAVGMERHRFDLCACADREEQIAGRVEALYADAATVQRAILAENPDLEATNRSIFAGRPLAQQFTIQAQGERLGAATWRALAQQETDATRRAAFVTCADLEETSARVLETILAATPS